ncbi:CHAT domain-containing protein [Lentinula raphanica]|nr:CHAT domain-containing protein [Lentinula raphanica]
MENFDILREDISQHRERFNANQKLEDLDALICLEEQALNLLDHTDIRHIRIAEQHTTDLEVRDAISLSLDDTNGLTSRDMTHVLPVDGRPGGIDDDNAESNLFDDIPEEAATQLELQYAIALSNNDNEGMARAIQEHLNFQQTRPGDHDPPQPYITDVDLLPPGQLLHEDCQSDLAPDLSSLAIYIHLLTTSLDNCPLGHPQRIGTMLDLALALSLRYEFQGSQSDLDATLKLLTEALELCPPSHPERGRCLTELAAAHDSCYKVTGSEHDVNRMIQLSTEALEFHVPGHRWRGPSLNNLANAYFYRHGQSGSPDDLNRTINLYKEALELMPLDDPNRAGYLSNLAASHHSRYKQLGQDEDLEAMVTLQMRSLELRPPGHPHRTASLANLAVAINARYERFGLDDDLEWVINLHDENLKSCPVDYPNRSASLNNLAASITRRYKRFGSEDDLDRMVELYRQALDLIAPDNPNRDGLLNNLAVALMFRHDRTGLREDLNKMIELHEQALELRPPPHPDRAETMNNLAEALNYRYSQTGSPEDLEKRIELLKQAAELLTSSNTNRSVVLSNLACALDSRYAHSDSPNDLEQVINLHTQALELRPRGHADRGDSLNNLAIALRDRYHRFGSDKDLQHSLRLHREARIEYPQGHPRHARITGAFAASLSCVQDSPARIDELFSILREVSNDFISPLNDTLHCALQWVSYARALNHDSLSSAYEHVIQFLRRYLTIGPTMKHQYNVLLQRAEILSLPMAAAAHAISKADPEKAIELLDAGRSLLWSEMRRFREPLTQLELVDQDLAARFESLRSELQMLSSAESTYDTTSIRVLSGQAEAGSDFTTISYDHLLFRKRKVLQEYEKVLGDIRARPGMEHFLQNLPFSKLREAAKGGPVIVINCSQDGSHVIIIFADRDPTVIALEDDFHTRAIDMQKTYLDALITTKYAENAMKVLGQQLKSIMSQLWTLVVSRIVEELTNSNIPKLSRIWWCPTSALTMLPFHAAGSTREGYLIDSYISSYTPTLKALIDSRRLSAPTVVNRKHPNMLVVAQTKSSNLASAGSELEVVRKRLDPFVTCLDEQEAIRASVLKNLQSHDWAHFICHGTLSFNPFESALHLYDGDELSLNDIVKAHLPDAKFAFLAACHTAEQGRDSSVLVDEVLHLAGAMLFSGFRSVVGTLWEMEDMDGPKIADRFYDELLKRDCDANERHTEAAQALWSATKRMKDARFSAARWVNFVHIGV